MTTPPLFVPATWRLQPGLSGLPAVRRLGTWALSALAVLCLAWYLALAQDVWRGGRSPWDMLTFTVMAWLWWRAFRGAWQRWHAKLTPLLLAWAGEVQDDPPGGGWCLSSRVNPATSRPIPVSVRCWLQLPDALLCRIQSVDGIADSGPVHWCWVSARQCSDWHRFRTLINLPSHRTTTVRGSAHKLASAVASCTSPQHPSGRALRRSSDTFMPTQPLRRWDDIAEPVGQERL